LRIDFVRSECFAGSIGMTFCPGKVQYDAMSGAWHRDLTKDLRVIADVGIQAVVTLVTGQELNALQVPDLGEQTREKIRSGSLQGRLGPRRDNRRASADRGGGECDDGDRQGARGARRGNRKRSAE
jgi:hypothetical protein